MKREASALVVIGLLFLVLLSGVLGGLWTFLSIEEVVPFILVSGIVGVFVWGFKTRVEGDRRAEVLRIERIDYRWPKLSLRIWFAPLGLCLDGIILMYGAFSTWQTVVAYLCDNRGCGYGPVLTFANGFSIALFGSGVILFGISYHMGREIQRDIKHYLHGGP